jgi:hypothetical protein
MLLPMLFFDTVQYFRAAQHACALTFNYCIHQTLKLQNQRAKVRHTLFTRMCFSPGASVKKTPVCNSW